VSVIELILTGIGLAMDAFAVSVCKGLAARRVTPREMALAGGWFGGFQMLMPLLGYLLGSAFAVYITAVDHWIAFVLLGVIGGRMVWESFSPDESADASFGVRTMFLLAVATSIDALAVGITFALLPDVSLPLALALIGGITFLLSAAGVKIGQVFGSRFRAGAERLGGVLLVLMGVKILLEHLGALPF
jgi:putative Mn2+ efflux pump MntP